MALELFSTQPSQFLRIHSPKSCAKSSERGARQRSLLRFLLRSDDHLTRSIGEQRRSTRPRSWAKRVTRPSRKIDDASQRTVLRGRAAHVSWLSSRAGQSDTTARRPAAEAQAQLLSSGHCSHASRFVAVTGREPRGHRIRTTNCAPIHMAQIELWCVFYPAIRDERLLIEYRGFLSEGERCQHERFRFPDDRHRYLVTRALVRTALTQRSECATASHQWTFTTGPHGKPRISDRHPQADRISFNISHTKGLIVLGLTSSGDLGVDTENLDAGYDYARLAERFFAPSEVEEMARLPAEQQRQRFLEYWTLKESYLKARGAGLSIPTSRCSFDLSRSRSIGFRIDTTQHDASHRWRFWQFRVRDTFLVALCAERGHDDTSSLSIYEVVPLLAQRSLACGPVRASP